ncbi:MFS general substrate transporter [Cutaneotrichosporon oleaginosum]|uniref:Autophagy-related protein n=1 Tax=Cutaneotrichosporon oleaginosum TaxID=879819 RepID=A0A0J0XZJ8_9TREE|nr:MFS general substrate transporter [Cutaneotrichosporon oleaginosum]KLT46457.1 MFS general substrate transporter [Cutaneotrichosporon oleaginosum]TXT15175.1 hypothetical protein COLE_01368 [Cutaneotrichosporon oleaginosum]
MKMPEPHVRAWYWYAFAAEVFAACAMAIFLPITLEQMAREIGLEAPDYTNPCSREKPLPGATPVACRAHILGRWVDTASFSMYVKSTAVFLQALGIISIGKLADNAYWRKRLLLSFAAVGSITASLFLLIPGSPGPYLPVIAALITLVGNITYAGSIVCANAFLPGLAREDPEVVAARATAGDSEGEEPEGGLDENDVASIAGSVILRVSEENGEDEALLTSATPKYGAVLSRTMARISSTGVAIGFFSGVAMLALLSVPVVLGGGSTRSLMLAVGLSAAWWGVFTVPAGLGLPGAAPSPAPPNWLPAAWRRVASMITPAEIRRLPNLFTYLLAWIFLSDGFHTTTYTAILYASSHLHMSPAKVIIIGLVMQLVAVGSSIYAPRLQRKLGLSNLRLLVYIVIGAQALPLYACAGLIIPVGGLRTEAEMYVAAAWFGFLYGPFNSYARAVYAEIIPPGHESTFFSLFSLTDKSASFVGPLIVGLIADATGNIRLGFVFLAAMLALPVPVLLRVHVRRGVEEAAAWSAQRASAA